MSGPSPAAVAAGLVRETVPFPRLPWMRSLVHAYSHDFASVAPLFAGDPADPDAWRSAIARAQGRAPQDRRERVSGLVAAQLHRREAPVQAREAAGKLALPHAVAVVTGQQAGLFGGPLYTWLKAISALQIARRVERDHGVPAVPIFWADGEDHDWDEVRTVGLLDRDATPAAVTVGPLNGCGSHPVATLALDDQAQAALAELERLLAPTEFTAELLTLLGHCYRSGENMAGAFARLLDALLGPHGLVVFESHDPEAKPLASDVFLGELTHPGRTARLAREGGALMAAAGHPPQIEPADDLVSLFRLGDKGRQPIRALDDQCLVGDSAVTRDFLLAECRRRPEGFSPNVLLRPLVQDTLFPTVCYVAGPSELAYHAQLGRIYEAFDVPRPLLASRASATLLDSGAVRFLEKYHVPFERLQTRDDSVLNQLLAAQLPAEVEQTFEQTERMTADQAARLREVVVSVDPTLAGAVETTLDRIRETLKTLHNKLLQAQKKKDETLRRQFVRTRNLTFPDGVPQERLLGMVFFANRYGPGLSSRLLDALPPLPDRHFLITP